MLIQSILFLLVSLILLYIIFRQKKHLSAHGSVMTVVFDDKLNITAVVNALSSTIFAEPYSHLVGANVRDLEARAIELYRQEVGGIVQHITDSHQRSEDLFFEYTTNDIDGACFQTLCYAEHSSNGKGLLCHFLRMAHHKRVSGCGKCVDYVLAMGMRSLSMGVCIKHIESDKGYIFMNEAAQKFYRCSDMDKCTYPDHQRQELAEQQAILTGERVDFDTVGCDDEHDVEKRWYHISNVRQTAGVKGDYIVTTIADITEAKQHQTELETAQLYLGMAIGASNVSVWRYDIVDDAFHSLYGGTFVKDGDTMQNLIAIMHPDDVAAFNGVYHRLLSMQSKSEKEVSRVLDPVSGQYHYIKYSMTVVLSSSGDVRNILGTHKDITKIKIQEMELLSIRNSLDMAIVAGNILAWEYDMLIHKFRVLYGANITEGSVSQLTTQEAISDVIHPLHKERYLQFIHQVSINGIKDSIIIRGLDTPQGEQTYFEMVVSAVKNKQGDIVKLLGTRRDISRNQLQKLELERTQKYLSMAMDAGEVSVWIYDIQNKMFFTISGNTIAGEGLSMEDNLSMMHPDDAQLCCQVMDDLASGKKAKVNVLYRYKADGVPGGYRYYEARKIAVAENGVISYVTGTQKEVTKEHFYREELEQSNQRAVTAMTELRQINRYNKLIMDNANCGLGYITPDYVIRWENISTSATLSKYFKEFHKGDVCYKALKNCDEPCEGCIIQNAMACTKNIAKERTFIDGAVMDFVAIPVYDAKNKLEGTVIRIDNVTEKKRTIMELQQAKEKAERSDHFKSTFLANMSHEIRTPLNAIVGFSELIAEVDNPEEKREYSRLIAVNNELLLKLINDILDLSKIEAGYINITNAKFDIAELYSELYISFSSRMHSGVILLCQSSYSSCEVDLDRNRIAQVVTNFLTNAIKFTNQGSITMGYERTKTGVRLYVSDTGIGIEPENLANVFDRFEKINEFVQGSGLGLSICKSIVEAEGGTIGVDSVLGQGSTFWAEMPCEVSEFRLDSVVADVPHEVNTTNKEERLKVLVAEDTDSNYVLLQSILKKHYDISRALNGEQAVQALQRGHYDAVLMDIKMPVMDGLEATVEIRKTNTTIPIIALSANVFDSDRLNATQAGCTDFLAKPVDKALLFELLKRLCSPSTASLNTDK
ncbi:MAG: response regulator [Mucinivorans sp.]